MAYTTGTADLRGLLSDGPTVKRAFQKSVMGAVDGVNADFTTLENRYVAGSTVIYVNGQMKAVGAGNDYQESDAVAGLITFNTGKIPPANAKIRASYYWQYFLDTDLTNFLTLAMSDLDMATVDYTLVIDGLRSALLHYAAAKAYAYLATIWTQRISEKFLSQDSPNVTSGSLPKASHFLQLAEYNFKQGGTLRDDYYTRKGQREAPAFGTITGQVVETQPIR